MSKTRTSKAPKPAATHSSNAGESAAINPSPAARRSATAPTDALGKKRLAAVRARLEQMIQAEQHVGSLWIEDRRQHRTAPTARDRVGVVKKEDQVGWWYNGTPATSWGGWTNRHSGAIFHAWGIGEDKQAATAATIAAELATVTHWGQGLKAGGGLAQWVEELHLQYRKMWALGQTGTRCVEQVCPGIHGMPFTSRATLDTPPSHRAELLNQFLEQSDFPPAGQQLTFSYIPDFAAASLAVLDSLESQAQHDPDQEKATPAAPSKRYPEKWASVVEIWRIFGIPESNQHALRVELGRWRKPLKHKEGSGWRHAKIEESTTARILYDVSVIAHIAEQYRDRPSTP